MSLLSFLLADLSDNKRELFIPCVFLPSLTKKKSLVNLSNSMFSLETKNIQKMCEFCALRKERCVVSKKIVGTVNEKSQLAHRVYVVKKGRKGDWFRVSRHSRKY